MSKKKATGTREWAAHNINIQTGCEHDCLYCYAHANARRFKQVTDQTSDSSWVQPKIRMPDKTKYRKSFVGTVMFPTTHDITPLNIKEAIQVLGNLLLFNKVLLVTKPHLSCVRAICEDARISSLKPSLLWRFTIGTTDSSMLKLWEPGATDFQERIQSLAFAWSTGYQTSVSCEPLLTKDLPETATLVNRLRPFVTDAVWLGRSNHTKLRVGMNRPGDQVARTMAESLDSTWSDAKVRMLYEAFRADPIVKWKNSVKEVVGIPLNEVDGLDK